MNYSASPSFKSKSKSSIFETTGWGEGLCFASDSMSLIILDSCWCRAVSRCRGWRTRITEISTGEDEYWGGEEIGVGIQHYESRTASIFHSSKDQQPDRNVMR